MSPAEVNGPTANTCNLSKIIVWHEIALNFEARVIVGKVTTL